MGFVTNVRMAILQPADLVVDGNPILFTEHRVAHYAVNVQYGRPLCICILHSYREAGH